MFEKICPFCDERFVCESAIRKYCSKICGHEMVLYRSREQNRRIREGKVVVFNDSLWRKVGFSSRK